MSKAREEHNPVSILRQDTTTTVTRDSPLDTDQMTWPSYLTLEADIHCIFTKNMNDITSRKMVCLFEIYVYKYIFNFCNWPIKIRHRGFFLGFFEAGMKNDIHMTFKFKKWKKKSLLYSRNMWNEYMVNNIFKLFLSYIGKKYLFNIEFIHLRIHRFESIYIIN